ncbi:Trophoblast glycoprotein [Amphibalanus amphitrite]|uniref:Trophoblast glycoprotein n=1 Tax=Amphibalanus amphitrite TaxID=1232801 RepID=A0A6A4WUF1_AMPAM|nr:Trophoblast glycoprotein [Amphibalanus amphitrite]
MARWLLLLSLALGSLAEPRTGTFSKDHVLPSKGVNSIVHDSSKVLTSETTAAPTSGLGGTLDDDDLYGTDHTGCPKAFQGRCVCAMAMYANQGEKFVVNCTNTRFTDPFALSALPDNTEVLIFTGNFLERLPPNLFGTEFNFDDLETIDMQNNGITDIDGQAFHRVSSVKTLILNHNNLSIVDKQRHPRVFSNFVNLEALHLTNSFTEKVDARWYMASLEVIFQGSKLTKLKKLHLEQNEIWVLRDPCVFAHLPSLEQLYLSNNRLTDVNLSAKCLPKLKHLGLEYNMLRRLDANTTAMLDELAARDDMFTVRLTGNPFICDCNIQPLYHWLMTTQTRALEHEKYRCYAGRPLTNAGRPIMQLREMECQQAPARASAASVILGMLTLAACVVLVGVIFVQRRRLARGAKNLQPQLQTAIENVKRSRQYTNIEREEEAPEVAV